MRTLASWLMMVGVGASGCKGEPRAAEPTPKGAPVSAEVSTVEAKAPTANKVVIDHKVKTLEGETMSLGDFRGQALLIVNTASQCGYTPQYEGLQVLHERYEGKGLHVLAFPCNDFGGQEPGDAKAIREHLTSTYKVTFPVFEKQTIVGKSEDKSPLWRTLTEQTADGIRGEVKWNFTKFLVNSEGVVVARWDSNVDPLDPKVLATIDRYLPK